MLVLIGATPEGKKELVGFQTGVRDSAQSWRELLVDIKQRGLQIAPTSRLVMAPASEAIESLPAARAVVPSPREAIASDFPTSRAFDDGAIG